MKRRGFSWAKALLGREGLQAADRPTLVGLRSKSGAAIQSGSMLVLRAEVGAQELGWWLPPPTVLRWASTSRWVSW